MAACKDCRFTQMTTAGVRQCRRYPPSDTALGGRHPVVAADDWCGEFQPTPEELDKMRSRAVRR